MSLGDSLRFILFSYLFRMVICLDSCNQNILPNEIKVYTVPVGQGDGTIIKCPNGDITLLDMGNDMDMSLINNHRGIDANVYMELLRQIGNDNWFNRVNKIFLSHPDLDHYSFFNKVREEINIRTQGNKNINVFIGGSIGDYNKNYADFKKWTNDNLFSAAGGFDEEVPFQTVPSHCGYCDAAECNKFANCYWVNKENNEGKEEMIGNVINICDNWSLTLMTANFNPSQKGNFNSLVMKLTPQLSPEPSMIFFGDLERDAPYMSLIKASDNYYATDKNTKTPQLKNGLKSDVLMVPHHGAKKDQPYGEIYKRIINQYSNNAFTVISSDIEGPNGHPRCTIVNSILALYPQSQQRKTIYCKEDDGRITPIQAPFGNNFDMYQTTTSEPDIIFFGNDANLPTFITRNIS